MGSHVVAAVSIPGCGYVSQTYLDLDGYEEKGDVFERISGILGRSNGQAWGLGGSRRQVNWMDLTWGTGHLEARH